MTANSDLLDRYKRIRQVRFRLNNLLVGTISKKTLEDCGRKLGLFRKGTLVFGSEDRCPSSWITASTTRSRLANLVASI